LFARGKVVVVELRNPASDLRGSDWTGWSQPFLQKRNRLLGCRQCPDRKIGLGRVSGEVPPASLKILGCEHGRLKDPAVQSSRYIPDNDSLVPTRRSHHAMIWRKGDGVHPAIVSFPAANFFACGYLP